jgi:S1-C subfamily serine protease
MAIAVTKQLIALATILCSAVPMAMGDTFTGSGVVIGSRGEILTNSHVVEGCERIAVQFPSDIRQAGTLIARDQRNDLAIVRTDRWPQSVAKFREGSPVRAGDAVIALGYPLSGLLAAAANLTVGNVSALAGLANDSRYLQISAPVQSGNSGGPLLDASGHVVGIVTSKLNAASVARATGDIPQNVNFAIKAEVARTFLDSSGIIYRASRSEQLLSPADVGDIARPFTVYIECEQASSRSAAVPTTPPSQQRSAAVPTSPSRPEPSNESKSYGPAPSRECKSYGGGNIAEIISQYRHEHGLSAVKIDPELTKVAERQAKAMADSGIMDHDVAGSFASRIAGAHTGLAAENFAAGTKTWIETFCMWQASPGHNANLLQLKADSIGIAVARNDQTRYKTFWALVIAEKSGTR